MCFPSLHLFFMMKKRFVYFGKIYFEWMDVTTLPHHWCWPHAQKMVSIFVKTYFFVSLSSGNKIVFPHVSFVGDNRTSAIQDLTSVCNWSPVSMCHTTEGQIRPCLGRMSHHHVMATLCRHHLPLLWQWHRLKPKPLHPIITFPICFRLALREMPGQGYFAGWLASSVSTSSTLNIMPMLAVLHLWALW
jgi:hypothetical protein